MLSSDIDLRDLGPGDFERLGAGFGVSDGNVFKAQNIPGGAFFVLVEVFRFEDESSLFGFLRDESGQPQVLTLGDGEVRDDLVIHVSPESPFEREQAALRVLDVHAWNDANGDGKVDGDELISLEGGVGGVPTKTRIIVTLSEPVQVSREFIGMNANLIPRAQSGSLFGPGRVSVQNQGRQIVFTVELSSKTDFQFIVQGAVAESGGELQEAEERFFTTKTESVTLGSIAGSILMSDGSRPRGSVYAILVEGDEEIVVAQVDADESYSFPQLPDGSYTIVADLILDDGSFLGGAHEDAVVLEGGNAVDGVDISIEVPTEPVEPPVEGGPNADATASFDFGTGEGDQGEVSLEGVGPGADADVAVYFHRSDGSCGIHGHAGISPGSACIQRRRGEQCV